MFNVDGGISQLFAFNTGQPGITGSELNDAGCHLTQKRNRDQGCHGEHCRSMKTVSSALVFFFLHRTRRKNIIKSKNVVGFKPNQDWFSLGHFMSEVQYVFLTKQSRD